MCCRRVPGAAREGRPWSPKTWPRGSVPDHGKLLLNDLAVARGQLLRPEFDGEFVQFPGEPERHLVVLVIHRRAQIDADVERLVDCHQKRDGVGDFRRPNYFTVDFQNTRPPLAEAGTVVLEIKGNLVLAGRESLLALPTESLQVYEIVSEHRLALQKVQTVTAESAPQGVQ